MTSSEIRKRFLEFFKEKDHTVVDSDLLVPRDDPTLLFTGAGMNQFKEQFMGKNITYKRAASSQKCLRTADVENVGKTPRHHTFFEMLGNFSFGDYFKAEAIRWAWDFMTREMGIPEDKLWVSVYEKDDESYNIWLKKIGVPAGKIIKLGTHDNFWPADAPTEGPNGPCGPCSEIFYDRGKGTGCGSETCTPACGCDRFIEVWNLVFTEFERKPDGTLDPLPNKNIDTGMGLERIASVIQNVRTNFQTDLFQPIVSQIREELRDARPDLTDEDANLIADHIRAAVFAIADGVSPSNEKQGFVIRKLIRRACQKGGSKGPFLYMLVPLVAKLMKDVYPELEEKREHISAIINEEEKKFSGTLEFAMPILEEKLADKPKVLEGEEVFKLVDTYGLPFDVILEASANASVDVDVDGFEHLMERRKEQSRKGSDISAGMIFKPDLFEDAPNPSYADDMPLEAKIEFVLKGEQAADEILEGEYAEVIVSPQSSRFYAEAGGQVGDTGSIVKSGAKMDILNTHETGGRKIFLVKASEGAFKKSDNVLVDCDSDKMSRTAKNHTATHLLQSALRQVLGSQVKQSGSFVDDKRLRFDFTHMKKLTERELAKVEDTVNGWIEKDILVNKEVKPLTEAKGEGALSFFGEKYGDTVRVVTVGEESKELCGGSHVDNTGQIDLFKIVHESSVASGIRRIEALTGDNARCWLKETLEDLVGECAQAAREGEIKFEEDVKEFIDKVAGGRMKIDKSVMRDFDEKIKPALLKARENAEKKLKKLEKNMQQDAFNEAKKKLDEFAQKPEVTGKVNLITARMEDCDMDILRKAVRYLEKKTDKAVILLAGSKDDKAFLTCSSSSAIVDAGELINSIAGCIKGGGGGNANFAQAGGKDPEGLEEAIEKAKKIIAGK